MKKIAIGTVLILVLASIAIWITKQDSSSTMKGELLDFAISDTASVSRIFMKDESGRTVELRRDNGSWILNDVHRARQDAINILLTTMKKVKVRAPVSQQEINTVLKNIIADNTYIEAYSGNTLLKSYYVGGPDREHTGTYMLMKGSQRPFITHIEGFHGFLTPRYFVNENEWMHRAIFEYKATEISSIELTYHDQSSKNFRIDRGSEDSWSVQSGDPLSPRQDIDSYMLSAYIKQYEMVHYESFEETKTEAFIDSVKNSQPMFTIALTDQSGEVHTVSGFSKPIKDGYDPEGNPTDIDIDRLYLLLDTDKLVVGQYVIFDKLTKGVAFFKNG